MPASGFLKIHIAAKEINRHRASRQPEHGSKRGLDVRLVFARRQRRVEDAGSDYEIDGRQRDGGIG